MLWLLSILAFLIIFSVLILVHEFGHFFAARKCGVRVEEFGLGMPPRLWGYRPKNSHTLYSFNAIPFGGFVKLHGEDSHNPAILKHADSFASKPAWQRIIIIVAGVLMNFLLAWVLLTVGFIWGMKPLIINAEDVFAAIKSGVIQLQAVEAGAPPAGGAVDQTSGGGEAPAKQEILSVPKVVVLRAQPGNRLGLEPGQVVEKVAGQMVFEVDEMQKLVATALPGGWDVSAGHGPIETQTKKVFELPGIVPEDLDDLGARVVISGVLPQSNADKAGLREGDAVLMVHGENVASLDSFARTMKAWDSEMEVEYMVERGGAPLTVNVKKGENGLIGVMLSPIVHVPEWQSSFYVKTMPYAVQGVEDVRYPWWQAPGQALSEMGRLSVLTVEMFVNVFASVFTKLSVPDGVAGPVGIAQMTFVFVQEGLMSLMRFTALLSLSLAIINILPFPGLDGGRFFLIVVPLLLRRRLNPKLEAIIHFVGFVMLMILILLVTFNDILKLWT